MTLFSCATDSDPLLRREDIRIVIRSLLIALEELTLLVLPHGGQKTARRNAWRAAADLHVAGGVHWTDPSNKITPIPRHAPRPAAAGAQR